jgi:hypothetical protein
VGWSRTIDPEAGFATAAAVLITLALSVVAAALMGLAVAELKRARSDLVRLKLQAALDGAQRAAVLPVLQNGKAARLAWRLQTPAGEAQMLAEPEAAKLGLAAAAQDSAVISRLGAEDAAAVKERLEALAAAPSRRVAIADLDDAPRWRACAGSVLSRYGRASAASLPAAAPPASRDFAWRLGEVWRMRATAGGWSDDRLVRFTGDPRAPVAVIDRTFTREQRGTGPCDGLFATR